MLFVLFKQKTAYEMRIRDWSSDVCSSDLSQRSGGHFSDDALGERARLSRDADQVRWPCVHDRFEQSGAVVRTDGLSRDVRLGPSKPLLERQQTWHGLDEQPVDIDQEKTPTRMPSRHPGFRWDGEKKVCNARSGRTTHENNETTFGQFGAN